MFSKSLWSVTNPLYFVLYSTGACCHVLEPVGLVSLLADIHWEDSPVYKRYIVSLYWAVTTITSVGYAHPT